MLTGNGVIGQSGGPTSVINSTLAGVIESVKSSSSIKTLYGMHFGIEGFMAEDLIDLTSQTERDITGLRRTPGSALGSSRHKMQREDFDSVLEVLKKYDIRYFFLIGGNDTMDTIHRIVEFCRSEGYELCGIGLPKTVDNDLNVTDHTPGFPSAARSNILNVLNGGCLAKDMKRVDKFVVYQTIGRDAGWLAASTALAKKREEDAPHLIYTPEIPFDKESFLLDVQECVRKYGWVSVVTSEGVCYSDGTPISAAESTDKFGNTEFGAMAGASAGLTLHRLIREATGWRGEFQITESLIMSDIDRAEPNDLEEAYLAGREGVRLAERGEDGVMVTLQRQKDNTFTFGTAPLSQVAVTNKVMPRSMLNERGNFVTEEFLSYMRPLISALPSFTVLDFSEE